MDTSADSPARDIRKQLKAISLTATVTLATFGVLVMVLPAFDFWAQVLPPAGKYETLARVAGILLSALLAYREVRHEWGTHSFEPWDIRPSGVLQVMLGGLLTLVYLATHQMPLGQWADLIYAIEYCGIVVLLSFGFIRLAKKAYDFSTERTKQAERISRMRERTEQLQSEAQRIRSGAGSAEPRSSNAAQTERMSSDDFRFIRFVTIFFAGITATVTGFAVLNQIITILPPIIRNPEVITALSVLIATILVGSNYTSDFLEQNLARKLGQLNRQLDRRLARRNVVESGIGPVSLGLVCLVLFLAADTSLHSRPSNNVLVDVLVSILQIGIFSFISFGLWRLGVYEYVRRNKRGLF